MYSELIENCKFSVHAKNFQFFAVAKLKVRETSFLYAKNLRFLKFRKRQNGSFDSMIKNV